MLLKYNYFVYLYLNQYNDIVYAVYRDPVGLKIANGFNLFWFLQIKLRCILHSFIIWIINFPTKQKFCYLKYRYFVDMFWFKYMYVNSIYDNTCFRPVNSKFTTWQLYNLNLWMAWWCTGFWYLLKLIFKNMLSNWTAN